MEHLSVWEPSGATTSVLCHWLLVSWSTVKHIPVQCMVQWLPRWHWQAQS